MKRVIKNQNKMKNTMYIVFGVFALALFGITMSNPSYAEEGLIIDDALDAVAQQITSGSGGFEKVEEEKIIQPVGDDEGEDEDVVEPEVAPVEEIEEGEGENSQDLDDNLGGDDEDENSQDLDDTNLEGGDGDNVNGEGSESQEGTQEETQENIEEGDAETPSYDLLEGGEYVYNKGLKKESNLQIQGTEKVAELMAGSGFNVELKKLSNNSSYVYYYSFNSAIKSIVKSETSPSGSYRVVSSSDSDWPIYVWKGDGGIIYYYTEADKIKLNSDSSYMFYNMTSLENIDLSDWDTSSVTNMSYMFYNTKTSGDLGLSNWTTSSVTNMKYMFSNTIISGNLMWLRSWNTSAVENMEGIFYNSTINGNLDLSNWSTSSVEHMSNMFNGATISGDLVGLSSWDVSNLTSLDSMFQYVKINGDLDLSSWDTSSVEHMSNMFNGATISGDLDLSYLDTSNVTDMSSMFYGATINGDLDLSNWSTSSVEHMSNMFNEATINGDLDLSNWNTSSVENMSNIFEYAEINGNLDLSSWDISAGTNIDSMFYDIYIDGDLDLSSWDVSDLTSLDSVFQSVKINGDLDLSSWNLSNVTSMHSMFSSARIYGDLDLSNWTMDGVKDMSYMFYEATINGDLDLSSFNTSNVTSMYEMFEYAKINGDLNLSSWDTSSVTNMEYMFYYAKINGDLDLSSWDMSSVENMYGMFYYAQINGDLNLVGWHNDNGYSIFSGRDWYNIEEVFYGIRAEHIYVSENFEDGIYPEDEFYMGGYSEEVKIWESFGYGAGDGNEDINVTFSDGVYGSEGTYCNGYMDGSYFKLDGGDGDEGCFSLRCLGDSHKEGNVCTGNTKTEDCIPGVMENGSYTVDPVEVTWNAGANSWNTIPSCTKFTCNTNYHTEDNATCILNTKEVACTQSGKPANSTYVPGNVQVTWNGTWNSGNWTTADNCAWSCDTNYHTEDNATCTLNTKEVACTQSGKPANSTYVPGNVQVTWNGTWNNGNWTTADNCAWSCDTNYHTEDNATCTLNIKEVACTESGKPANSSYVPGNVEVTWSGTWNSGNWTIADNCAWSCDENYHVGSADDSCEYNIKQENCIPGTIANGNYTVEKVNIEWNPALNNNQGGWNAIPLCTNFTCNTNFHKEGNTCKVDVISGGSSGGGGGGRKTEDKTEINKEDEIKEEHNVAEEQIDNTIKTEQTDTIKAEKTNTINIDQTIQQDNKNSDAVNTENKDTVKNVGLSYPKYTEEQEEAYEFAKENGITTMSTISEAKMNIPLTRIQMAKMLSNFAINVMGKEPDYSKGTVKFRDVSNKMDREYDGAVTNSYVLGIMGQNMKNNEFRPNDEVSRAEFVTALSRMLYETDDGQYKSTRKYYEPHMAKLYNEGIISKTDPDMKEKRGYVMIMLMRSVEVK